MSNYIDGFVLPIPQIHLSEYQKVAEKVAEIWKEYGAISYFEYVGDDLILKGTKSFIETINKQEDEEIIFGWVVFPSKKIRDSANKQVPLDKRMTELLKPLTNSEKPIFDATRMVYGGFKTLVELT